MGKIQSDDNEKKGDVSKCYVFTFWNIYERPVSHTQNNEPIRTMWNVIQEHKWKNETHGVTLPK